ncbi:MAG: enoyl-CoA hydratase/isomerase family protein, partial [Pseudomonadales bacterium]|nr:enoyl-CoA hydratase/isomerase family protein [Pseudomonadales bacterium]
MSFHEILFEIDGPMALVTINRAERHNAISLATLNELQRAVAEAADDDAVKVITITGAGGRAFASGSDL